MSADDVVGVVRVFIMAGFVTSLGAAVAALLLASPPSQTYPSDPIQDTEVAHNNEGEEQAGCENEKIPGHCNKNGVDAGQGRSFRYRSNTNGHDADAAKHQSDTQDADDSHDHLHRSRRGMQQRLHRTQLDGQYEQTDRNHLRDQSGPFNTDHPRILVRKPQ